MNAPSTGKLAATVRSMTGYAQAQVEKDGWLLRVSLRSVNHRFLDLRIRLPEGFDVFEPRIRQMLRDGVRRGHVDVTVNFESTAPTSVEIHRGIAENYLRAVEELRRDFALTSEPDLVALLRLPGARGSFHTIDVGCGQDWLPVDRAAIEIELHVRGHVVGGGIDGAGGTLEDVPVGIRRFAVVVI